MSEPRVIFLDNQPIFAGALAQVVGDLLHAHSTVHSYQDSLPVISGASPNLVVLDPQSGDVFRKDLIISVRNLWPIARLVILTSGSDAQAFKTAVSLGAHAYLLKTETIETLRAGIEFVYRGGMAFSFPIAALVTTRIHQKDHEFPISAGVVRGLTAREIQVIQLIGKGNIDSAIASKLGISARTVQRHVGNILNKLSCHTRSQAVARVIGSAASFCRIEGCPAHHTIS